MFRVFDSFSLFDVFSAGAVRSLLSRVRALFSDSDGVWIEFGDASQLNELYDQSGDVPAIGDPVGYITDQSGNGNHATQPVSNNRPTYGETVDGTRYIEFDGLDDDLLFTPRRYVVEFSVDYSEDIDGRLNIYVSGCGLEYNLVEPILDQFAGTTKSYSLLLLGDGGGQNKAFSLTRTSALNTSGTARVYNVSVRELKGNHATQPVSNSRPTYGETVDGTRYIEFDGVDDIIEIEVPVGGWSGTIVFGWVQGSYWADYDLPEGTWSFPDASGNLYAPDDQLVAMVFKADGGEMTKKEKADALAYVLSKGAGSAEDWATKSDWTKAFMEQNIIEIQNLDWSAIVNGYAAFNRTSFTHFDASTMVNVTRLQSAWQYVPLESFDASGFASMTSVENYCFWKTFTGCNLNQASVESILVNIDANGLSAPAATPQIEIDTDGSPLTAAAQNAITSLKTKGWDPVIDGVSQ